jgi:hypothetical protein
MLKSTLTYYRQFLKGPVYCVDIAVTKVENNDNKSLVTFKGQIDIEHGLHNQLS